MEEGEVDEKKKEEGIDGFASRDDRDGDSEKDLEKGV